MSSDARRRVVDTLTELSLSTDWRDRADAGRALASFAELTQAQRPLQRLLLDPADTFVTHATAEALSRRKDATGVITLAQALGTADPEQIDHISDAVITALAIFAEDRDSTVQICDTLTSSPEPALRHGATQLRRILAEINPVLYPHSNDRT